MGLADRIPLQIPPDTSSTDPVQRGLEADATQPPIGCQFFGSTVTSVPSATHTTLDINHVITFDPYNMVDQTNDRITLPFPGVWDLLAEVSITLPGTEGTTNAQITQGLVNLSLLLPMDSATYYAGASATGFTITHKIGIPLYVDRAWIATNTYLYIRAFHVDLAGGAAADHRLISFTAWLRSAVKPGKY